MSPETPVSTEVPQLPPQAPTGQAVTPTEGLLDPHPIAVERFDLSADGRTMRAYYWGGVDDCYTLAEAELAREGVRLSEGARPEAEGMDCIAIAVLKYVELDLPSGPVRDVTENASSAIGEPIAEAVTTEPVADVENIRPVAVERFELSPDGITLRVYYYGGVTDCYGLAEAYAQAVSVEEGGYVVVISEGSLPGMSATPCIDLAQLKVTEIELPESLFRDLSRDSSGS